MLPTLEPHPCPCCPSPQARNLGARKIRLCLMEYQKKGLDELCCDDSMITDGALLGLVVQQGLFCNLRVLSFRLNLIGSKGVEYLCRNSWPSLQTLNLSYNTISNEALQTLTKFQMPRLQRLILSSNKITGEGTETLAGSHWPNMKVLQLNVNNIGVGGLLGLAGCYWPQIQCFLFSAVRMYQPERAIIGQLSHMKLVNSYRKR